MTREIRHLLILTHQHIYDLNKPYENLRIGIVDEFNIDALSKESQTLFNESLKVFESLGASIHKISLPNINQSVPTYYVIALQNVLQIFPDMME